MLGMKRNHGNGSAAMLLLAVEVSYQRDTVYRWEKRLANALLSMSRSWYAEHYGYLRRLRQFFHERREGALSSEKAMGDRYNLSYEIHTVRGDATNAAVAHDHKAHVCQLSSVFVHVHAPVDDLLGDGDAAAGAVAPEGSQDDVPSLPQVSSYKTIYPDVAKVPHSCGALEQRSMYLKQLRAAGVETWVDGHGGVDAADVAYSEHFEDGRCWRIAAGCSLDSYVHLKVWLFASDQGTDQVACSEIMAREVNDKLLEWMIHQYCLEHVNHLMVKRQLARLSSSGNPLRKDLDQLGGYWSITAKVINTWRAHGNAARLREAYSRRAP
jgi:hypothetical protein